MAAATLAGQPVALDCDAPTRMTLEPPLAAKEMPPARSLNIPMRVQSRTLTGRSVTPGATPAIPTAGLPAMVAPAPAMPAS